MSTNEASFNVQSDMPQPQSVIKDDDGPLTVPWFCVNNKAIPKVIVHKPTNLVQKDTTSLRRSSRVSKPSRKLTFLD